MLARTKTSRTSKKRVTKSATGKKRAAKPKARARKKSVTKKPKSAKKKKTARKPFGGYTVSFAGRRESLEQVFGSKRIPPGTMTKALWAFIKAHNLG